MNSNIAYRMSCFYNDRDTDDVCNGMNMKTFIDWMEDQDPMIQLSGKLFYNYLYGYFYS